MALLAGTITSVGTAPNFVPVGTGLAKKIYELDSAVATWRQYVADHPEAAADAVSVGLPAAARRAEHLAAAIIAYIVSNIEVDGETGHVT